MSESQKEKPSNTPTEAVELGTQLYKNLNMSSDAVIHLLPRVQDERIKTGMSAALCFYEKTAGKVKRELTERGVEPREENPVSKMAAHMGIVMNTAMDATDSHIAQMVIEGSTMSITEAVKLKNQYRDKPDCDRLVTLAGDIAAFEDKNIQNMKQFL